MYFWLIDSLCCRGLQRMSTIWSCSALHNNKDWLWDLCEQFCRRWESVWAGHIQTMLPRRLFCLSASYKWQHGIAATILVKRRRRWRRVGGEAGQPFMGEQGTQPLTRDIGWTARGPFRSKHRENTKQGWWTWKFRFFLRSFRSAAQKKTQSYKLLCSRNVPSLSLSVSVSPLSCSFFCFHWYSTRFITTRGWRSAISSLT